MTKPKHSKLPWSIEVEIYDEDEDGTPIAGMITIPEIERVLHDPDWADSEDWDRDMANGDLIVQSVNSFDALVSALKVAINTVECDSLDKDGNELPWYTGAKKALKLAGIK